MDELKTIADTDLWEKPFDSSRIPEIDLYMDQLLSLIEEKEITKTMINNYSKERLIKPLKGKKYSKEQIIQILCIMNLKGALSMSSIKDIMPQEEDLVDYKKVYDLWTEENDRLAETAAGFVKEQIAGTYGDLSKEEQALMAAMMLSSCSIYLTKLCETMIAEVKGEMKK